MVSNIIWGLVGMTVAFSLIKWRRYIVDFTGRFGWAEKYLGAGGSYNALVLIGVLIFILAVTKLSGKLDDIFNSIFGKYFN